MDTRLPPFKFTTPEAVKLPVIEAPVDVNPKICVPPTAQFKAVAAVPKIPVFALFVGLKAHVVTELAPVQTSGPEDENPPDPPENPPIPDVVTDKPPASTRPADEVVCTCSCYIHCTSS